MNKKLKFKFIYIPITLMLLLGSLMIGITDYIAMGFTLDIFHKPDFWINLACTNCGILCVVISILLIKVDQFKEIDVTYNTLLSNINEYYNSKDYQTALFEKFCFEENKIEKKETYRNKIHIKYSRLRVKPKDLQIKLKGSDEQKQKNRYCIKTEYYETLMSDYYIDNYIDKLHVKYNAITESVIFSGVVTQESNRDYITKKKVLKIVRDLAPKYILTFSITVLAAMVTADLKDGITLAVIFKTASKLFSICSQIYFAHNYSNKYCNEVILHDIRYRYSIINKFKLWVARKINELKEVSA